MTEFKAQSLHASASEAITNNVRVEVEAQVCARSLAAVRERVVLHLHGPDHQRGRRPGAAAEPPLDHHGRDRPHRRGAGPGRRRGAAGAAAGRVVPVHVELRAQDIDRRHARHLPDGHRRRRALRRRDRARSPCTSPTPSTRLHSSRARANRSRRLPPILPLRPPSTRRDTCLRYVRNSCGQESSCSARFCSLLAGHAGQRCRSHCQRWTADPFTERVGRVDGSLGYFAAT